MKLLFVFVFLYAFDAQALELPWSLNGVWRVQKSKLQYEVSHPMHNCEGESSALSGQVKCEGDSCYVKLITTVASFRSRDSDKDRDMLKYLKADQFAEVVIEGTAQKTHEDFVFNAKLSLAGRTLPLKPMKLQFEKDWSRVRIRGDFDWSIFDFNIEAPKLLGMPIQPVVRMFIDITFER